MQDFLFEIINLIIKLEFPQIKQITTQELTEWLANTDIGKENKKIELLHLLDVRNEEEYTVSHLQNAERVDFNKSDWVQKLSISSDATIIVYCSVGYRSAIAVQQLQKAGFIKVFNLEGGIFNWANAGNTVFRFLHQTSFVHPYNKIWGKLLKKRINKSK
jgi:rhodanese-related sulfurtransferase